MVIKMELFVSPYPPLDFFLWDWMKTEVYERKVDAPDELLARNSDAAARIHKREDHLRPKHAIFARQLRWALKFTVGFSNIYCEL